MKPKTGLILVNTGHGKGKTTAALGAAVRACGAGLKVLIIQFIKGKWRYGELEALKKLPGVEIRPMGLGLIKKGEDLAPHKEAAQKALESARCEVRSGGWDLIILDEVCNAMRRGLLDPLQVADLLRQKPAHLHMILTGRDCPDKIMDMADTVTRFVNEKHHLARGVEAQKGIEF